MLLSKIIVTSRVYNSKSVQPPVVSILDSMTSRQSAVNMFSRYLTHYTLAEFHFLEVLLKLLIRSVSPLLLSQ